MALTWFATDTTEPRPQRSSATRDGRWCWGRSPAAIDPSAERMAIESAIEVGSPLLVTNVVHLPNYPTTLMLVGPGAATLPHEEALEAVRATAERAAALGIRTEHLRVSSKRPVKALLEVVARPERRAARVRPGPRADHRRAATAERRGEIRRNAGCLVWIAAEA